MQKIKLFVSALESSSNLHLRNLSKVLPKNVQIIGVCDSQIGQALYTPGDFSIMGFSDVLKKIFFLKQALHLLSLEANSCDKVLLMDSSSFNLRLAKKIRQKDENIQIMYYIAPQIWAWKEKRKYEILKLCDKIACILPFEVEYYEECKSRADISNHMHASTNMSKKDMVKMDVKLDSNNQNLHSKEDFKDIKTIFRGEARYVGHPLLDIYTENINYSNPTSHIFTFMPGSRKSEISNLMPIFKELSLKLKVYFSDARFRLVVPPHLKSNLEIYGDIKDFKIFYSTVDGLKNSTFAFICSGTATLEAALLKIPFLLVYKIKNIDYIIARSLVRLKYSGLANILFQGYLSSLYSKSDIQSNKSDESINTKKIGYMDECLHKELRQWACRPDEIFKAYQDFDYIKYFLNVDKIRDYLHSGSALNVVNWLFEIKS